MQQRHSNITPTTHVGKVRKTPENHTKPRHAGRKVNPRGCHEENIVGAESDEGLFVSALADNGDEEPPELSAILR